jgi:hypothetical protein
MIKTLFDGVIGACFKQEGGGIFRYWFQPNRNEILENNLRLRNEPDAIEHKESMGWELSIPEVDFYHLIDIYPDLNSSDKDTRERAWKRFLGSSEADPYRVRDRTKIRVVG